jgi:hypothetical protein
MPKPVSFLSRSGPRSKLKRKVLCRALVEARLISARMYSDAIRTPRRAARRALARAIASPCCQSDPCCFGRLMILPSLAVPSVSSSAPNPLVARLGASM